MRMDAIALPLVLFTSLASAYEPSDLVGTWQSNEKMTLESMKAAPGISEKNRAFFRNHFFGRLTVVLRPDESSVYFADEKPEDLEFRKHLIRQLSDTRFQVTYSEDPSAPNPGNVFTLEGNCYSIEMEKWKFSEYFCRVQKD